MIASDLRLFNFQADPQGRAVAAEVGEVLHALARGLAMERRCALVPLARLEEGPCRLGYGLLAH